MSVISYGAVIGGPILFGYLGTGGEDGAAPPAFPITVELIVTGAITVDIGQAAITKEIISKTITTEIEG